MFTLWLSLIIVLAQLMFSAADLAQLFLRAGSARKMCMTAEPFRVAVGL